MFQLTNRLATGQNDKPRGKNVIACNRRAARESWATEVLLRPPLAIHRRLTEQPITRLRDRLTA